jgi:hypothetical protein
MLIKNEAAHYGLTGNPFVDTGLNVLVHLAGLSNVDELTTEIIRNTHDGRMLAQVNARLKSFTMVFGTNGPLTQTGYRPKGRKKELSEKNIGAYTNVLAAYLHGVESLASGRSVCEICGEKYTFDFDGMVRKALSDAGVEDHGTKQIGREWFPLAGSIGNDAQALPSASRGISICPKCLFAVHYMPLGLMLMQGRLVCFQSTMPRIALELIGDIVDEYREKIDATEGKVEMIGGKEGTTAVTRRLMAWMKKRHDVIHEEDLSQESTLYAWLFTNSGASADCELLAIPNSALQFLWMARKQGLDDELLSLLKGEDKRPEYQLLSCIQTGRDYRGLYPFKGSKGASPDLYALYQQIVLNKSYAALSTASSLAKTFMQSIDSKDRKQVQKSGYIEGETGLAGRKKMRASMLQMGKDGEMPLATYDTLFPTVQRHPIRIDFNGWRIIGYYLFRPDAIVKNFVPASDSQGEGMVTTHPKILEAARLYFDDYVNRKSLEHFERHVLNEFNRTYPNEVRWLRYDIFVRLAKDHPDFTYGDWDEFVLDDNGQSRTQELVFQMRLALANLYRECVEKKQATQGA